MSPSSIVIHREVFDKIGAFDEGLPACEDYELWLRIAARWSVCYIPEKLIVKYGGHADQLSQAYYAMDRFRVYALDRLLQNVPELSHEKCEAAREMLVRKAGIVYGARSSTATLSSPIAWKDICKGGIEEPLRFLYPTYSKRLLNRSEQLLYLAHAHCAELCNASPIGLAGLRLVLLPANNSVGAYVEELAEFPL